MSLETRLWRTGYADNLFTTVPRAVRQQLGLTPTDKIAWRVEGGVAEVTKLVPPAGGDGATDAVAGTAASTATAAATAAVAAAPQAHTLYKQSKGNSLYTAIPMWVIEQLRLTDRSRAEWELHGDRAHLRRA